MGSTIECKTHIDAPKREPWFICSDYIIIVLLLFEITPIVTLVYSYQYY